MRFVNDAPETIYGWEKASQTALLGICRGTMTWADNARNPLAAFGTHLRLYAMDIDGNVTDITPATSYSQPSISFTTTLGSALVTITGWTHGLVADQKFKFENSSVATVGGVTINGTYTAVTIVSATSLTFTAAQVATSAAGPTAATVDATIYLAPGQVDGLAGLGFGVGGMGSGGFGSSSASVTLYPRTWSAAPYGQNGLFNPRGGGLYEWAPNTTATELVTNPSFTAAVGWVSGAGFSTGGGASFASSGTASNLDTSVTALVGAWHLLNFRVTVGAGSFQTYAGGLTIGSAITATGNYLVPFYSPNGGAFTVRFAKDATFTGTLRYASVQVLTTAQLVPHAPTQIGSMFVTAERIVVACGSNLAGSFDALQIDWSDAEDNQDWTSTDANLAGGDTLPYGGRVVRGLPGARDNSIWTDEGRWSMRFNGNPLSVYDLIEMGNGCGLCGPNAATQVAGVWYWRTPSGAFYADSGSGPVPIPCTLSRDMQDRLSRQQQDKIFAHPRVGKNYVEVWWRWPAAEDGNEVSEYVIYDTIKGSWCCGTWDRTACVDASVFPHPLTVDTSGAIWYEELGFSADGASRTASLTGAYNKAPGADALIVNGIKPDSDDLQGGYTYIFESKTRDARGIHNRIYPALNITSMTGQKSIRVKGEQVRFTITVTGAPSFWRQGALEADVIGIAKSA